MERNTVSQKSGTTQRAGERYRFFIMLLILSAVVMFTYLIAGSVRTEAASSPQRPSYKYYTSVRIQKGDTLSQIAVEYHTDECGSLDEYMDEICAINHISRDSIHSGQYLAIPYYSSEYLE